MKRFSFWIIISIFTFLLGLGAVLTWLDYNKKEIVEVEAVPLFDNIQSKSFPGLSRKISELQKGKSGYFPKYTWAGYDSDDNFMNDWSSRFLKLLGEKSFLDKSEENTEVYRFFWFSGFGNHIIFVRVERKDDSIQLFSKTLERRGNQNLEKVSRKEHKILTEQQWCSFLNLLEESKYWEIPADYTMGRDGSHWILEGFKDNRYHVVNRWSPKNNEYREVCVYLLKLSGVDTDYYTD